MFANLLKLFREAHPHLLALGTAEGSILKTGGNLQLWPDPLKLYQYELEGIR
jgi:hypothetical protein